MRRLHLLSLVLAALLLGCAARPVVPPASHPDFDTWWDYGDPAATQIRFEQLLSAISP